MDDQLRQLARRYQETGDLDDEVRWLRERVRAGALSDARVRLAAHLGHPAAVRVLGEQPRTLRHPAAEGIVHARCGIYRCELDHARSTGELLFSPPLGWSLVLACAEGWPERPRRFQRSSPETDVRCQRALEDWLDGARPGLDARTGAAWLLELALEV